jgi:hypothetical protein
MGFSWMRDGIREHTLTDSIKLVWALADLSWPLLNQPRLFLTFFSACPPTQTQLSGRGLLP